jgi:NAD(P)H-dependent FMN reductase
MTDLIVIAASNGENLTLADRFAAAARQRGRTAEVLDLTALELPLFTPRALAAGMPQGLAGLQQRLAASPRWVICAPEYNGSIPPVLTSAIAWLSVQGDDFRALFNERPVVIATHSGGGGHTVMTALRLQLAHLGAQVVGRQLVSNGANPAKDSSISDLVERLLRLPAPQG